MVCHFPTGALVALGFCGEAHEDQLPRLLRFALRSSLMCCVGEAVMAGIIAVESN